MKFPNGFGTIYKMTGANEGGPRVNNITVTSFYYTSYFASMSGINWLVIGK